MTTVETAITMEAPNTPKRPAPSQNADHTSGTDVNTPSYQNLKRKQPRLEAQPVKAPPILKRNSKGNPANKTEPSFK